MVQNVHTKPGKFTSKLLVMAAIICFGQYVFAVDGLVDGGKKSTKAFSTIKSDLSISLKNGYSFHNYKSMGSTSEIFLAQPSQPNPYRYDFSYYYGDNSGDNFSGYFYDTPGLYDAGQVIHQTGGYYVISSVSSGDFDISYKDTAYIKSYYDGDTKKMSNTLYESPGYKQIDTSIKINDLLSTSGYLGYAYDPSVPVADAFFGDAEVTYHFSANESVNFMAAYISDLPYWTQPNSYPGSCAEVAAGILLSFWDRNGYDNLITTDWQRFWPDNTNSVASYVRYIGMLANNMGYPISPSGGTFTSNIGSGIDTYAEDRGYDNFSCTYYLNTRTERPNNWEKFKDAINAGHPVMLNVQWSAGGHSTVGRGYWNDGKVATNFGWGTDYDNVQLDWNRKSGGDDYYKAYINNMIDVYYSTTGGSTYSGVSLAASLEVSLGDNYCSGDAGPMPVMGSDFPALSMAPPSVNTPAEHYHGLNGRRMYVMGSDWSRIQVIHEEEKSIR
jgi:hypothetical protein